MNPLQEAQYIRGNKTPIKQKQQRYMELIKEDPRCIRYVHPKILTKEMIIFIFSALPKYQRNTQPGGINVVPWEIDYFFDLPDEHKKLTTAQIKTLLSLKGYADAFPHHPIYYNN